MTREDFDILRAMLRRGELVPALTIAVAVAALRLEIEETTPPDMPGFRNALAAPYASAIRTIEGLLA
jgi:hypothetical protein